MNACSFFTCLLCSGILLWIWIWYGEEWNFHFLSLHLPLSRSVLCQLHITHILHAHCTCTCVTYFHIVYRFTCIYDIIFNVCTLCMNICGEIQVEFQAKRWKQVEEMDKVKTKTEDCTLYIVHVICDML